jgi:AbrB family looped-hinge helix DNA binding protein
MELLIRNNYTNFNYIMPITFEATLVKWGNSVGFAIPKPIRDGMNLNPGDKITIVVENDKIYIKKIPADKN